MWQWKTEDLTCDHQYCGALQHRYSISGTDLIRRTSPVQGFSMLLLAPFIDSTGEKAHYLLGYTFNSSRLTLLVASCAFAIAVNVTQFLCLGKFSAVSYQLLGLSSLGVNCGEVKGILVERQASRAKGGAANPSILVYTGHAKTCMVLVLGGLFFGGVVSWTQMAGVAIAGTGMVAYSRVA